MKRLEVFPIYGSLEENKFLFFLAYIQKAIFSDKVFINYYYGFLGNQDINLNIFLNIIMFLSNDS